MEWKWGLGRRLGGDALVHLKGHDLVAAREVGAGRAAMVFEQGRIANCDASVPECDMDSVKPAE